MIVMMPKDYIECRARCFEGGIPLVEIDIGLLADQVAVSATDTLDLGQGVHDLLLAINLYNILISIRPRFASSIVGQAIPSAVRATVDIRERNVR